MLGNRARLQLHRLTKTSASFGAPRVSPSTHRTWTSVTTAQDGLTIHALKDTKFPYVWLRDSCQGPESVHISNRQKLHRSSDVGLCVRPEGIEDGQEITTAGGGGEGVKVTAEGIEILWRGGHKSVFTKQFLERHATPENLMASHLAHYTSPIAWTNPTITSNPDLYIPYEELFTAEDGSASPALIRAMTQLMQYGLVFITGVPNRVKDNEGCELRQLANTLGEIRETFYGQTWDVINIKDSKNIAYTNLDLGLHMDLLYLQHPPRFQALHCLRNRVTGGTSVFVDALEACHKLFQESKEDFDLLTKTPVAFEYQNDGHHLYMQHPTIQLEDPWRQQNEAADKSTTGPPAISHINYSPPFQGPLPLSTPPQFFSALRRFTNILNDPANTYSYTLKEGDCVVFDNRRVLHARTAFEEKTGADAVEGIEFGAKDGAKTNRWLKGCYLEADAVADRMRVGRAKLGML